MGRQTNVTTAATNETLSCAPSVGCLPLFRGFIMQKRLIRRRRLAEIPLKIPDWSNSSLWSSGGNYGMTKKNIKYPVPPPRLVVSRGRHLLFPLTRRIKISLLQINFFNHHFASLFPSCMFTRSFICQQEAGRLPRGPLVARIPRGS